MNKICFKKSCKKPPAFTCKCQQGVYFCKKHMGDHMMLNKDHKIISLYVILDDADQEEMKEKCEEMIDVYDKVLQKTQDFCKSIINSIILNSKKLIDEIHKYKSAAHRIYTRILRNEPLDSEDLNLIDLNVFNDDLSINLDSSEIIKSLDSKFKNYIDIISSNILQDNFVFYQASNNQSNFNFFNIEKNKIEAKSIISDNSLYLISAAQYTKNLYYLISSSNIFSQSSRYNNYSDFYIQYFNLNNLNVKTIHTSHDYNPGPLIILDSSLYIFSYNQNYGSVIAFKYEISKGTISQISTLPENFAFISVSKMYDKILFTGNSTENIYRFDNKSNTFEILLTLAKGNNKFLIENWIVSIGDRLFEIKNDKLIRYQDIKTIQYGIAIHSSFRNRKFLYFVTSDQVIYRIDTYKKILSKVVVS